MLEVKVIEYNEGGAHYEALRGAVEMAGPSHVAVAEIIISWSIGLPYEDRLTVLKILNEQFDRENS